MLVLDTNVFIYARREHEYSTDCRTLIGQAAEHPEWAVPVVVLMELTHYFGDNGEYARKILTAFRAIPPKLNDFIWAGEHSPNHAEFNDHMILHTAHRAGCTGVVSYDEFFGRQTLFTELSQRVPGDVL